MPPPSRTIAFYRLLLLLLLPFTVLFLHGTVEAAPSKRSTTNEHYPAPGVVPSVTSPEVLQWLSEIDLSAAPDIRTNTGEPPECPETVQDNVCYWTCDDCSADDVVECPNKNDWGLTFDDGPTPQVTPDLLQFLDEKNVKATFFLVGGNVVQYPDLVLQEAKAGHHLASHTWSHHALTTLTNEQIVAEIRWTEKAIFDVSGYRIKYVRPPYGDVDNRVRFVLKKMGYIVVDWTGDRFDSNDWKIPEMPVSQVTANYMKAIQGYANNATKETKGFITLEHDLTEETVAIAKKVIPLGLARNLTITTVAACLGDSAPYANMDQIAAAVAETTTTTKPGTDGNQHHEPSSSSSSVSASSVRQKSEGRKTLVKISHILFITAVALARSIMLMVL
ncbi:chitin deacetylase [Podila humilis]|nr:chitin deacetylase [Podila humilis]